MTVPRSALPSSGTHWPLVHLRYSRRAEFSLIAKTMRAKRGYSRTEALSSASETRLPRASSLPIRQAVLVSVRVHRWSDDLGPRERTDRRFCRAQEAEEQRRSVRLKTASPNGFSVALLIRASRSPSGLVEILQQPGHCDPEVHERLPAMTLKRDSTAMNATSVAAGGSQSAGSGSGIRPRGS
jgi:hypothetical protein